VSADSFVIFFASFSGEDGCIWTGTTGADVSRGLDGAKATAADRLHELSRREWTTRVVVNVVSGLTGEVVHSINWSR